MKENKMYRICLEDYGYPRYAAVARPYFGTMEDITELATVLNGNEWTKQRYGETVRGVNYYARNPGVTHRVAGQKQRLLTPVEELDRKTFPLEDKRWIHFGYSNACYPMKVEHMDVCQVLLRDGDTLYRCARVAFDKLQICTQNLGWFFPDYTVKGFPGQIRVDEYEKHSMRLFILMKQYPMAQVRQAMEDMSDLSREDLALLGHDFLGEV